MNSLIPLQLGCRLRDRARKSTLLKLKNYIELRDFIIENEERIMESGWMAFYSEAGGWMDYAGDTVRRELAIIRSYPDEKLRQWIDGGLSFDHIETANWLQNIEECHYDGDQILDAALDFGDEHGKRMTVEAMEIWALGEKVKRDAPSWVNSLLRRLGKFPTLFKWDAGKSEKFNQWLNAGQEFFV